MLDWWGPCVYEYYAATEGGGTIVTPQEWLARPGPPMSPVTLQPLASATVTPNHQLRGEIEVGSEEAVAVYQPRAATDEVEESVVFVLRTRHPDAVISAGIDMDTAVAGLRDAMENL